MQSGILFVRHKFENSLLAFHKIPIANANEVMVSRLLKSLREGMQPFPVDSETLFKHG